MTGKNISRRSFLNLILGGGLAAGFFASLYAATRYLLPPSVPEAAPSSVVAAKVGELAPNSGKIFRFGQKPGLLVCLQDGTYRAFVAICTHLDCTVQYRPELQHIWCACHDGHYDINGTNIAGPPPRPLTKLEVVLKGDDVLVSMGRSS